MQYLTLIIPLLFLTACGSDSSILDSSNDTPEACLYLEDDMLHYLSSVDIYGFQFDHNGCASGASPGESSIIAGFSVSSSESTVIGFSIMGNYIPSGSGTLINGIGCEIISNTIISGIGGAGVSSELSNNCSQ